MGCAFLFSGWYTRKEVGLRLGIFFSAAMISGAFGGLFAAGIAAAFRSEPLGLETWRWLFILEGIVSSSAKPPTWLVSANTMKVTVLFAFVTGFTIPDWPTTTKWLTVEERALGIMRLVEDAGSEEEDISPITAFKMTVSDYKVWLCILGQVCLQAVASLANFLPTLVQSFGFGTIETLLLTAPPYVLTAAACIGLSWFSDKTSKRSVFILFPTLVAMAGIIITFATVNVAARYFSIFLMLPGTYGCFQISNAWMSNIAARPQKKRAIALAMNTAFGNSAMIWTPYLYPASEGPRYYKAWAVNLALMVVCLAVTVLLRLVLARENKRMGYTEREEVGGEDGQFKEGDKQIEMQKIGPPGEGDGVRARRTRYQI